MVGHAPGLAGRRARRLADRGTARGLADTWIESTRLGRNNDIISTRAAMYIYARNNNDRDSSGNRGRSRHSNTPSSRGIANTVRCRSNPPNDRGRPGRNSNPPINSPELASARQSRC